MLNFGNFSKDKSLFDFSDNPHDSNLFDPANKSYWQNKRWILSQSQNIFINCCRCWRKQKQKLKKEKGVNKNVIKRIRPKEFIAALFNKMFYWKEFKVNCIELELMMSAKLLCLVLTIKNTY